MQDQGRHCDACMMNLFFCFFLPFLTVVNIVASLHLYAVIFQHCVRDQMS